MRPSNYQNHGVYAEDDNRDPLPPGSCVCQCGHLIRPGTPADEHVNADGSFRAAPDWVHVDPPGSSWCDDDQRAAPHPDPF